MASYHRVLKVFGRSINDKTLQCDCDIHPWEVRVDGNRWSGRIRLIGFVDVFFLISYSGSSRFHDGIIIYKDDHHIQNILKEKEFKDVDLQAKISKPTDQATSDIPASNQTTKYTFSSDTVEYIVTSIGHPIGLRTRYDVSEVEIFKIQLRKHQDPLLKTKYKAALKQHDTLDMIQEAMKLGLVDSAELVGHVLSHGFRGGSTLDIGKGFVGCLSASKERRWAGLSGDKV